MAAWPGRTWAAGVDWRYSLYTDDGKATPNILIENAPARTGQFSTTQSIVERRARGENYTQRDRTGYDWSGSFEIFVTEADSFPLAEALLDTTTNNGLVYMSIANAQLADSPVLEAWVIFTSWEVQEGGPDDPTIVSVQWSADGQPDTEPASATAPS